MPTRDSDINRRFGEALRRRRGARGLTQEELAHLAAVHPTYVSQLERGLKSPSLDVIAALADALGARPYQLVRDADLGRAP